MDDVREPAWTTTVLRVVLVVAVALGLCAMHVLAAAATSHHHEATPAAGSAIAVAHHASSVDRSRASQPAASVATSTGTTEVAARTTVRADDHEPHHSVGDCVLFLGAGIALVTVLLCSAARSRRPSYRLGAPWPEQLVASSPWRGPPPWHWPRISLCVIRV